MKNKNGKLKENPEKILTKENINKLRELNKIKQNTKEIREKFSEKFCEIFKIF